MEQSPTDGEGMQAMAAAYVAAGAGAGLWAALSDLRTRTVPRLASHLLVFAGIAYHLVTRGPLAAVSAAAAALVTFAALSALSRRAPESFGMGDARMAAATMAYLGPVPWGGTWPALVGLVTASATTLAVLIALAAAGRLHGGATVPLAPSIACWAVMGSIAPQLAALGIAS